jgi:hypothetical protein
MPIRYVFSNSLVISRLTYHWKATLWRSQEAKQLMCIPLGEVIPFVRDTVFSAPAEVADEETPFKSDRSAPGLETRRRIAYSSLQNYPNQEAFTSTRVSRMPRILPPFVGGSLLNFATKVAFLNSTRSSSARFPSIFAIFSLAQYL